MIISNLMYCLHRKKKKLRIHHLYCKRCYKNIYFELQNNRKFFLFVVLDFETREVLCVSNSILMASFFFSFAFTSERLWFFLLDWLYQKAPFSNIRLLLMARVLLFFLIVSIENQGYVKRICRIYENKRLSCIV
jgi:hypothetical protein